MIDVYGDLWDVARHSDAVCVTTNAFVKKDGQAAMTAGCALEAALRWPTLSSVVGTRLTKRGNHVHCVKLPPASPTRSVPEVGEWIVTYPVKDHWKDLADYELIHRSAHELRELADRMDWERVVLPRPGCGYGHRTWEDVRPLIEDILDDRFFAVTWKETP